MSRLPKARDPDRIILRRSIRVAIFLPLSFAVTAYVLKMPAGIDFAVYGTFFFLASSDFLAVPRTRALAYLITGSAGLVAIVMGSLAAQSALVGVVATFIVSFILLLCGVLRGFLAAATLTVLLPFVIAVSAGPALADLPQYLVGYLVAISFSTFAAMLIWPAHPVVRLREGLAEALSSASALIRTMWSSAEGRGVRRSSSDADLNARVAEFQRTNRQLRERYEGNPVRPGGLTRRERALTRMVGELDRLRMLLRYRAANLPGTSPQDGVVADATADVLQDCARAIVGEARPPAVSQIEHVRAAYWEEMERSIDDSGDRRNTRVIIESVEEGFSVRIASVYAELLLRDTRQVMGASPEKTPFTFSGLNFVPEHLPAWEMLRAQLTIHSPWFRNAARGALSMSIAVAIVSLFPIQNGFWVVLGAVAALRSDALGTARTAFGTAVGVTAGFVVGAGALVVIGDRPIVLWILVPILVFLACYTSGAVSLIIGQASFTVFVIIFYSIFLGPEIETGVVRVSDIVLGVVVSLVASALLWPRGIIANIQEMLSIALERATEYLVHSYRGVGRARTPESDVHVAHLRLSAHDATARAEEAFDLAIVQAGRGIDAAALWSSVLRATTEVVAAGDLVDVVNEGGKLDVVHPETADLMVQCARDVANQMKDQLRSGGEPTILAASVQTDRFAQLAASVEACIDAWRGEGRLEVHDIGARAMQLLILQEWLEYLKILADQYWGVEPDPA